MEILTVIIFTLILIVLSLFGAIKYNRAFEEVIPISCSFIILILFLCGILKHLKFGAIFVMLSSLIVFLMACIHLIIEKDFKEKIKKLLTPGFFIFMLLSCYFVLCLKGKLLNAFDEFSHWGDVVKTMNILDDFATNQNSYSMFKTYPPAMALFQYFMEKIYAFIGGTITVEWFCNYAYSILCISMVLPFTKYLSFKRMWSVLLFAVVLIFVPFTFYDIQVFRELYIEPSLAFLYGSGLLHILLDDHDDKIGIIHISTIISLLVLTKDNGVIFGVSLMIMYILKEKEFVNIKKIITDFFLLLISFGYKLLWKINISLNDAIPVFNKKVDLYDFFLILIGRNETYRRTAFINYFKAFINKGIYLGNTGVFVNYFCVLLFTILFVLIILELFIKYMIIDNKLQKIIALNLIILYIGYLLGMVFVYLYEFTEGEALSVICFSRYSSILYLSSWLFFAISLIVLIETKINNKFYLLSFFLFLSLCAPLDKIFSFTTRENVSISMSIRDTYTEIEEKTKRITNDGDKIYLISVEDFSYVRWYYKFLARPANVMNGISPISINEQTNETKINISEDELMDELISDDYKYVATYVINEDFIKLYNDIFENENEIKENSIYRVNKETKKLELCS